MHKLLLIAPLLLLTGCSGIKPYVGTAYHSKAIDSPEVNLDEWTGIIGAEIDNCIGEIACFIEHESGMLVTEEGYGFNKAGAKYYFK